MRKVSNINKIACLPDWLLKGAAPAALLVDLHLMNLRCRAGLLVGWISFWGQAGALLCSLPVADVIDGQGRQTDQKFHGQLSSLSHSHPADRSELISSSELAQKAFNFLRSTMPSRDKNLVSEKNINQTVALAIGARFSSAWAQEVPVPIWLNYVLPYAW